MCDDEVAALVVDNGAYTRTQETKKEKDKKKERKNSSETTSKALKP